MSKLVKLKRANARKTTDSALNTSKICEETKDTPEDANSPDSILNETYQSLNSIKSNKEPSSIAWLNEESISIENLKESTDFLQSIADSEYVTTETMQEFTDFQAKTSDQISLETISCLLSSLSSMNLTLKSSPKLISSFLTQIKNFNPNSEISSCIKQSLELMSQHLYCDGCSQYPYEISLECGDKYCANCIQKNLEHLSESKSIRNIEDVQKLVIKCDRCDGQFSKQDIKNVVVPFLEKLRPYNFNRQKCKKCGFYLDCTQFSSYISHRNLCRECEAVDIRSNYTQDYEDFELKERLNEQGYCSRCKRIVFVVGDYLSAVCSRDHFYCKLCSYEAIEKQKCLTCKESLTEPYKSKIERILTSTCQVCLQVLERDLLVPRTCCDPDICIFCQSNSSACLICQAQLTRKSKDFLTYLK